MHWISSVAVAKFLLHPFGCLPLRCTLIPHSPQKFVDHESGCSLAICTNGVTMHCSGLLGKARICMQGSVFIDWHAQMSIPRFVQALQNALWDKLQPGDMITFQTQSHKGSELSHPRKEVEDSIHDSHEYKSCCSPKSREGTMGKHRP